MRISYTTSVFLSCLIFCGSSCAKTEKCDLRLAPKSLEGLTLNYRIINNQSDLQDTRVQGVMVSNYSKDKVVIEETGTQADSDMTTTVSRGSFRYKTIGCNQAVETSEIMSPVYSTRKTQLFFDDKKSGRWEQSLNNDRVILSGKFSLVKTSAVPLAPEKLAGLHVALIIKSAQSDLPMGSYPNAGLVVQSYSADGSLSLKGTGPGTIDSRGIFQFKKVSANTAVEQTIQTSDFFTLPYTMVYTFETENSGRWEQNFGNGLIKFSGTFDTFSM